jgi:hypothetical protein
MDIFSSPEVEIVVGESWRDGELTKQPGVALHTAKAPAETSNPAVAIAAHFQES